MAVAVWSLCYRTVGVLVYLHVAHQCPTHVPKTSASHFCYFSTVFPYFPLICFLPFPSNFCNIGSRVTRYTSLEIVHSHILLFHLTQTSEISSISSPALIHSMSYSSLPTKLQETSWWKEGTTLLGNIFRELEMLGKTITSHERFFGMDWIEASFFVIRSLPGILLSAIKAVSTTSNTIPALYRLNFFL